MPLRARAQAALPISVGALARTPVDSGRPHRRSARRSVGSEAEPLRWDLATEEPRTYICDPEGVIAFRPEIAAGFRTEVVLANAARDSGYRGEELELWVSPSQAERWVYVRSPSGVERSPVPRTWRARDGRTVRRDSDLWPNPALTTRSDQ